MKQIRFLKVDNYLIPFDNIQYFHFGSKTLTIKLNNKTGTCFFINSDVQVTEEDIQKRIVTWTFKDAIT